MAPKRPQLTNVLAGYLPPVVWGSQPPSPQPAPAALSPATPTRPGRYARPAEATLEPLIEPDDADDWADDEAQTTFRPAMTPPPAEAVGSGSSKGFRPPTVSRVRRPVTFPAGELITPAPQQPLARRTASGLAAAPATPARSRTTSVLATTGVCMAVCAVGFLAVTAYHHLSPSAPSGPVIERSRTATAASPASALRVEPLALPPPPMPATPAIQTGPRPLPAPGAATLPVVPVLPISPATPPIPAPVPAAVASPRTAAAAALRLRTPARRPVLARQAARPAAKRTVRPARKATPSGWVDPFADP